MKRLLIFALIAAFPAAALSVKDYSAKTDREQKEFLSAYFARLVIAAGKTDQQLAAKITSYYGDKAPGAQYPQGYIDLTARIGRLVQDRSVDPSKVQIEEVILQTTAEHFGVSYAALNAAPPQRDFQTVAPPKEPKPAPKADTSSGGFGDLIGDGGFIKPPEMTPAVCVPLGILQKQWRNPPTGSDMAAFKDAVTRYVMNTAIGRQEYMIKSTAWDDFARSRRVSPATLVELVPDGKECAKAFYLVERLSKPAAR